MASDLQPVFTNRQFTADDPPTRREAPIGWPIVVDGVPTDQMAAYRVEQRVLAAINAKGTIRKPHGLPLSGHIARIMCGNHGAPSVYRALRQLGAKGMVELERGGGGTSPYRAVSSIADADAWATDEWKRSHKPRKPKPVVAEELEEEEEEPEHFPAAPPAFEPRPEEDAFHTCPICGSQFYGKANIMAEHVRYTHWADKVPEPDRLDVIAGRLLHKAAESIAMYDEKCRELQQTQADMARTVERFQEMAREYTRIQNNSPNSLLEANYNALLEQYATLQAEYDKLKASTARHQQAQRTYNIIESLDERSREALLSLIEEC